ncbi:MAG TPA: hypothetical protein DCS29_05045 [Candidatus Magasanikbacteria bacterium]|nr:MAG: hypothetical protein A2479_00750 [Candidatus Magasanikbacteria bacterium RIFOXYC2_FULL_39_8]HAT04100.1 hypothetical protein [Candidatus Magasanikbacteria bacterium]
MKIISKYPIISILFIHLVTTYISTRYRGDFTFDEMFSTHYSLLPLGDALRYWVIETNPPLHTFLLRGWLTLLENTELCARLLSIVFSSASVIALYTFTKKFLSQKYAALSSFILIFSTSFIQLSTEARTYSLFLFLTILSFYLFYSIFFEDNKKTWHTHIYILIQTLLLVSHLTAVLIPLIQLGTLLLPSKNRKNNIVRLCVSHIIPTVIFCIWFIPSALSKWGSNTNSAWYFKEAKFEKNILEAIIPLFVENAPAILGLVVSLGIVGLLTYSLTSLHKHTEKKYLFAMLFLWALTPTIVAGLCGIYIAKYVAFSLPAIIILLVYPILQIQNKKIYYAVLAILGSILIPSAFIYARTPIQSWDRTVSFIQTHEIDNTKILIVPFNQELLIKKYYHGKSPVVGIYPRVDSLPLNERIVRYNWQEIEVTREDFDLYMQGLVSNTDTIFFLQYSPNIVDAPVPRWFIQHGWNLTRYIEPIYEIEPYVFEFEKVDNQTTPTKETRDN